jgi:Flp pilus assembly protein TadB
LIHILTVTFIKQDIIISIEFFLSSDEWEEDVPQLNIFQKITSLLLSKNKKKNKKIQKEADKKNTETTEPEDISPKQTEVPNEEPQQKNKKKKRKIRNKEDENSWSDSNKDKFEDLTPDINRGIPINFGIKRTVAMLLLVYYFFIIVYVINTTKLDIISSIPFIISFLIVADYLLISAKRTKKRLE